LIVVFRGRLMALFRHPHLVRGTVHTPHGAFTVVRGTVDMPDEVGESLGWAPVETTAGATDLLTRTQVPATPAAERVAVNAG
jgi:hypothetical protein